MTENARTECLFVGGSADGKRLEVDASQEKIRIPSMSGQPALQDPVARALDNDPIPDETRVYETYKRVEVEDEEGLVPVYALNMLGPEAVERQVLKYFGDDAVVKGG